MIFFNGFSLKHEPLDFAPWIEIGQYSVSGFSYGAIEAFEYVQKVRTRVDRLQLISPAFFQTKPERYRTLQMDGFRADSDRYLSKFLHQAFAPYDVRSVQQRPASIKELETLLYYTWDVTAITEVVRRGVRIDVYLGAQDRIIDAVSAREFFTPLVHVTWVKDANHFLKEQ